MVEQENRIIEPFFFSKGGVERDDLRMSPTGSDVVAWVGLGGVTVLEEMCDFEVSTLCVISSSLLAPC